jgi:hypothetical protein
MKQILLCLFLICALYSLGQQKNDSKVIVTVTDTANLFNRLAMAFYEKGYTMETKDESAGFINTKEKEMDKYSPYQTIRAFIRGNTIMLSSKIRMGSLGTFDIEYNKAMDKYKTAYSAAWNEMKDIAKQFGNNITYSK